MKKSGIFILLCFMSIYKCTSQNSITHPTIQHTIICYKAVSQNTLGISHGIQGLASATVSLKTNTTTSVVHFKISDVTTNNEIYQASYNLASQPVINNGQVLFQNNSGVLLISYEQAMPVMPHKYEIWTEDDQHNVSTILSLTK